MSRSRSVPTRCRSAVVAVSVGLLIGCGPVVGREAVPGGGGAIPSARKETPYTPGTRVAAALLTVVYLPTKLLFPDVGAVTSGIAYVVTGGDRATSRPIWNSAVEGDYVVTPAMIAGEREIRFAG